MNIEEEIAWKIRNDSNMYIRQGRQIAASIMPLFRHAQEEAWEQGRVAGLENASRALWEDGDPILNPYTEQEAEHD